MNSADLRWTTVNFLLPWALLIRLQPPRGPFSAASHSLLSGSPQNPSHPHLCFGSRGHCPLLNFFFACSSPPSSSSKGCNYTPSEWCCLSASSWAFDLSWLLALTCLGRARKGNGWELPSNHELVLPLLLFLPVPFPPPSQPKGSGCVA